MMKIRNQPKLGRVTILVSDFLISVKREITLTDTFYKVSVYLAKRFQR
jgi:hypothetical protein